SHLVGWQHCRFHPLKMNHWGQSLPVGWFSGNVLLLIFHFLLFGANALSESDTYKGLQNVFVRNRSDERNLPVGPDSCRPWLPPMRTAGGKPCLLSRKLPLLDIRPIELTSKDCRGSIDQENKIRTSRWICHR